MGTNLANLTALAAHYRAKNKQRDFCVAVRSMEDAAGAHTDIRLTIEMVKSYHSLWNIKSLIIPETYIFSRGGICANAILFYARATRYRNGARGAVELLPYLPEALVNSHNDIHNLRDDAIAHLGPGKRFGKDVWYNGAIVAHIGSDLTQLSYQNSHMLSETLAIKNLEALLPVAETNLFKITKERGEIVLSEIERLSSNASFVKKMTEFRFDPNEMYWDNFPEEYLTNNSSFIRSDVNGTLNIKRIV